MDEDSPDELTAEEVSVLKDFAQAKLDGRVSRRDVVKGGGLLALLGAGGASGYGVSKARAAADPPGINFDAGHGIEWSGTDFSFYHNDAADRLEADTGASTSVYIPSGASGDITVGGGTALTGSKYSVAYDDLSSWSAQDASAPLSIPTYVSGDDDVIHVDVIHVPEGWNGYRYWMHFTPFSSADPATENPSVVASNDGDNWEVPAGLTNPIYPEPSSGHYSDTTIELLDDDRLCIVFRWNNGSTGNSKLYAGYSDDGVSWTSRQELVSFNQNTEAMCPSLERIGNEYHLWTVNGETSPHTVEYRVGDTVADAAQASPTTISMTNQQVPFWNFNVTYHNGLFKAMYSSEVADPLYLAHSTDGETWESQTSVALDTGGYDSEKIYQGMLLPKLKKGEMIYDVFYCKYGSSLSIARTELTTSTSGAGSGLSPTGYTDVTSSRSFNTWYQNSTGKPLEVKVSVVASVAGLIRAQMMVNDTQTLFKVADSQMDAAQYGRIHVDAVVPDGYYYQVNAGGTNDSNSVGDNADIDRWVEQTL